MQYDVLNGTTVDYYDADAKNILDRWGPMAEWARARADAELEPFCKYTGSAIAPRLTAYDRRGRAYQGVNFASQDYLGLSHNHRIVEAAKDAADALGVHSAGSAALMGLTRKTLELEQRLAAFVETADATVFPTGWGAGFGTIRALIKPSDHIVIDVLAHACLQEAAGLSTANVHRFPHCSSEGVERRLKRIRQSDPDAGILVVTETLFSMDSDVANIPEMQAICRQYQATLLVDVAHDLGAIGDNGRGFLEIQNALGGVDIVMGSFSKTFASNGGFVASDHPALKWALRYGCGPLTFSNALSPVQASTVLACLDIVQSDEGKVRRDRLMNNALYARDQLSALGFELLGEPSAIVPVILGDNETSRLMTNRAMRSGAIVNLVEYPAVAKNACRWRIQLMSEHTKADIDELTTIAASCRNGVASAKVA